MASQELKFTKFDAADYLDSEETIAEFLAIAEEDDNLDVLASARQSAAKARARLRNADRPNRSS